MKPRNLFRRASLITLATAGSALAFPENFHEGFYLDSSGSSYLLSYESDYLLQQRKNVEFSTYNGGLVLYSPTPPTAPTNLDGGLTLLGNPVSIVLEATADNTNFGIWKSSAWWGNSAPIFKIEGATGNTTFTESDVAINGGSLSVSGSPVITSASASSVLTGQNFVQLGSGGVLNIASTSPTSISTAGGLSTTKDSTINGITVGRGSADIATNTAIGASSLASNSQGNYQTAVGTYSLMANTSGIQNTALGAGTLSSNIGGSFNTAVGAYALYSNTGGNNVAIGNSAFMNKTTGLNSIAVGKDAGRLLSDGSNLTFALNSIFIGAFSKGATTGTTGSIVIGGSATSDGPNTTVIGSPATLSTRLEGETRSESLRVSGNTVLEGDAEIVGNTVLGGNTVIEGSVTLAEAQGDISMGDYQ